MCGIYGGWWKEEPSQIEFRLAKAQKALAHRGSDDHGLTYHRERSGLLAMGHNRLSIIDLSAAGHQPMDSTDKRYSVVFNGEIYNYRELRRELEGQGETFHSDTDTEVLLSSWRAWGKACLPKLRGMFAFALHDRQEKALICVRDPFGIKPLFYRTGNDSFLWSSEIKAIRELHPGSFQLNFQQAYDYLTCGTYDTFDQTFFDGIHHLPPGHILLFDLAHGRIKSREQWWFPSIEEDTSISFNQAAEKLRVMFLNNVRLHLRSDVPLGAALSGGLDSSAVVCAMRSLEPDMPIHTFTFVAADSPVNEESWADIVNHHVKAISHKIIVSSEEFSKDLDDMILAQGEPFGSTSIYAQFRVFQMARENNIIVTLDGQGADEMLAGYKRFFSQRLRSLMDTKGLRKSFSFAHMWSKWPGRSLEEALKIFSRILFPTSLLDLFARMKGHAPTPDWLNASVFRDHGIIEEKAELISDEQIGRHVVAALRNSQMKNGLPCLLRHADRNSMRWTIESRVPFLTSDLSEFLLSLPEEFLISGNGETKHVFRAAMRDIVPDTVLERRDKIGFATPEKKWLQMSSREILPWLDSAKAIPFLKHEVAYTEMRKIIDCNRHFTNHAWRLLNFCRWYELMNNANIIH